MPPRGGALDCLGEETIVAFIEGALGTDELAALEAHARRCASCEALLSAGLAGAMRPPAGPQPAGSPDEATAPLKISASFTRLARGTSIGRYTVLDLVGSGGMGEVYAAYDPKLDRRVALKLLQPRPGHDQRHEARLLREAQ